MAFIIIPEMQKVFAFLDICNKSHEILVGIVLGYRLDNQGSKVQFLVGAGNFLLHHCIQNGSGA
jgi:hypothetical protein